MMPRSQPTYASRGLAYNSAKGARRHGGQKLTLVNRSHYAATPGRSCWRSHGDD